MKNKFNPLIFLASLGAGGIAVMPFVLMQYTIEHGKGLITRAQLWANSMNIFQTGYYLSLETIMILFSILHVVLTFVFLIGFIKWIKTNDFKEFIRDPLRNSAILAPLISILMTMNLFIGPVRYFLPIISNNFQSLFLPAMAFWSLIFITSIFTEIWLLVNSMKTKVDLEKTNFGWLIHPFLLGMLSTVGSGIAAMAKNSQIANPAAFMSLIAVSMGLFLFYIKSNTLFQNYFNKSSLPERHLLPSILILIPNVTLFAITFFRLGHFLEAHHAFHLDYYFYFIIGIAFAFEIWYLLFGLFLLKDYFKNNHFKDFYITQWGLICPLVAFVVLGSFAYNVVFTSKVLYLLLTTILVITVVLYLEILVKQIKCINNSEKINCQ